MSAFPNLFRGAERPRVTCRRAGGNVFADVSCGREKSAGAGSYCRALRIGTDAGRPGCIGFFIMAWRLLRNMHELSAATGAAVAELCHVPCFGRRGVGDRCPQGADVVEVVVRALDPPS